MRLAVAVVAVAAAVPGGDADPCISQKAWYPHGHVVVAKVEFVFLNWWYQWEIICCLNMGCSACSPGSRGCSLPRLPSLQAQCPNLYRVEAF